MPKSLKLMIKKLAHDGKITEEEYNDLIKKLDGHDAEMIVEVIRNTVESISNIELLTDREQRIFLKAMSREREICKRLDDEYDDKNTTVSLVKVCNEIERKVKQIWE